MIYLTDLINGGGKISVHQNLCGGTGSITKITSTKSDIDTGLLILETRDGIRPSIGMHGHPKGVVECYTILAGYAAINGTIIECGGSMLCQSGEQHSLQALADLVLVEFKKLNEKDLEKLKKDFKI